MWTVVGISGVTCGGKSQAASSVKKALESLGVQVALFQLDDFFVPEEKLPYLAHLNNWNWDQPDAVDFKKLLASISEQLITDTNYRSVIIVEGISMFANKELSDLCQLKYFLTLDYEQCKTRRGKRTDYVPPDLPGFFEEIVWPEHEKYLKLVNETVANVAFIRGDLPPDSVAHRITKSITQLTGFGERTKTEFLWMKYEFLSVDEASTFVGDPTCGAISLFVGTTRNNFEGKEVVKLEYDTYEQMALLELKKLCEFLRNQEPEIAKICVLHRLGDVPVTQASVIIAISSPHRPCAIKATEKAIEELKRNVPIWKKEVYYDGTGEWKQNAECTWKQ